jgi:hypothetical protein
MKLLKEIFLSYQLDKILFSIVILFFFEACSKPAKHQDDLKKVKELIWSGEFGQARLKADSLKQDESLSSALRIQLDSLVDVSQRIRLDFCLNDKQVKDQLSRYYPVFDSLQFERWIADRKLEMKWIDGVRFYFKNAVPNLFRLDDEAKKIKIAVDGFQPDSLDLFCLNHTKEVIAKTTTIGKVVLPVRMKLNYTIEVDANAVPACEIIRCWMPFPREGHLRQTDIQLISSNPEKYVLASKKMQQRTVYFEKPATKDLPTVFNVKFEMTALAQYFDLNPVQAKPYQADDRWYQELTSERPPQIVFTPEIMKLGKRIVGTETNPLLKTQKIFQWISDSIRWASALEYCTIPFIPEYVLENHHGDCGMQTLLFMTLARSQGIPAKWQSGWMLHPGHVNLHDWCEVYFEGIGWVPVDQSFGLQKSDQVSIRNFYNSGIDSYRMIVNDDYGQQLFPPKKFFRSEPFDFQRGEIEWKGGNLYFDGWDWHMEVKYYPATEN